MNKGLKPALIGAVLILAIPGALAAADPTAAELKPGIEPESFSPTDLPNLAGIWTGSWADTVFFVGGAVSCTIAQNGSQLTAVGTMDFSVLWPLGIEPLTLDGTILGNVLNFTYQVGTVGSGGGILVDNHITGSGTVGDPLNFGDFIIWGGTATDLTIVARFDYSAPGGGAGILGLVKSTAAGERSWGELKSRYRGELQ